MNISYILIGYYIVLGLLVPLNILLILRIIKYKYLGPYYKVILIVYYVLLFMIIGFTHLFIFKFDWSQQIYLPAISDFTDIYNNNANNQLNIR